MDGTGRLSVRWSTTCCAAATAANRRAQCLTTLPCRLRSAASAWAKYRARARIPRFSAAPTTRPGPDPRGARSWPRTVGLARDLRYAALRPVLPGGAAAGVGGVALCHRLLGRVWAGRLGLGHALGSLPTHEGRTAARP